MSPKSSSLAAEENTFSSQVESNHLHQYCLRIGEESTHVAKSCYEEGSGLQEKVDEVMIFSKKIIIYSAEQ